jgi:hypothetical protein
VLDTLDLPGSIARGARAARTISSHEARRRQRQFIGRLMREIDPEPLQAFIDSPTSGRAARRARNCSRSPRSGATACVAGATGAGRLSSPPSRRDAAALVEAVLASAGGPQRRARSGCSG